MRVDGIDVPDNVVSFPWVDKWALICIARATRDQNPEGVNEVMKMLSDVENNQVVAAIKRMRTKVISEAIK